VVAQIRKEIAIARKRVRNTRKAILR